MKAKYYDTYLPFLLEACNDENRCSLFAVYGIGVCASLVDRCSDLLWEVVSFPLLSCKTILKIILSRTEFFFACFSAEALSRLDVVIRHPNAKH
ncbi:hypothetical protein LOK49_LG11G01811 [Camellia lanceoleosa]|uniref:Uncharacterized protein n=1 Tax=Camellia lanceoleosa TaxID=1840588 RepID=A0ACC0G0S4_9ERIC|nr:hypothetical protein LOK49_LG11G01811 [Camellia lanceoleosa]